MGKCGWEACEEVLLSEDGFTWIPSCADGSVSLVPAFTSLGDETCVESSLWEIMSHTSACEANNEGVKRTWGGAVQSLSKCKARCIGSCKAIDFFKDSGWCNTYDATCKKGLATLDGASSYTKEKKEKI